MKILDLPLKKKWYNMIESGVKTEEYRELSPFWVRRLITSTTGGKGYLIFRVDYTHVRFRYGYTKRTMLFKIDEITIDYGKPEWGAPDAEQVFIIRFSQIHG